LVEVTVVTNLDLAAKLPCGLTQTKGGWESLAEARRSVNFVTRPKSSLTIRLATGTCNSQKGFKYIIYKISL